MKLALAILTYNRIPDAKIQMRIVRKLWQKEKKLRNVTIYHLYDGKKSWYPQKYLEDYLTRTPNLGHYEGANLLLNLAAKGILKNEKIDYILFTSADVWLVKPQEISKIIGKMERKHFSLATSLWFLPKAYATEFFIIKASFAKKVFPFNIKEHRGKHNLLNFLMNYFPRLPIVEMAFYEKVKQENGKVMLIPGRHFVSYFYNRHFSKNLGFLSHHNLKKKKKILVNHFPGIIRIISYD